MYLEALKAFKRIYFIGVGGVSMSALAKLASVCGCAVSGSDGAKSEETETLAYHGVRVYHGSDGEREVLRQADLVVYTDAIPETHAELLAAKNSGKAVWSRAEFLGKVAACFPHTLAVAGSHGKTTCTAICAHILRSAKTAFTAHIGGFDSAFGNFYTCGEDFFVTEACEYKKNFLLLRPEAAIVLNIDRDHLECYEDETDMERCFRAYCDAASRVFVCADDERALRLGDHVGFGIDNPLSDYRATNLRAVGERYSFVLEEYGKTSGRVRLNAVGKCNVYNALAAIAAMRSFGFSLRETIRGVESFTAVKRRFERIGAYCGASVICDYAHHPKEISATVATATGICKGKLYVVFQPHTYSRTKLLLDEFVAALRSVGNLMIYKTYAAREKYDAEGSAATLARAVGNCLYTENVYALRTWLQKTVQEGDVVLFLGAGDIYYVAQYLLRETL